MENLFKLSAKVVERNQLRYTPAGLAIISLRLLHSSEQIEAGSQRLVNVEIPAVAIGEIATQCEKLTTENTYHFSGFIASKSLKNTSLQFHISGVSIIE